jgi:hypothetical protein
MRPGVSTAKLQRLAVAAIYVAAMFPPTTARAAEPARPARRTDYALQERVPMALVVVTPTGGVGDYSSSVILAADVLLAENTNLQLMPVIEQRGNDFAREIQACKGRLLCYVEKVRNDYQPEREDFRHPAAPDRWLEWPAVREILNSATPKAMRFMVVLTSVRQADGSDRLRALLIDTDAALDYVHRTIVDGTRTQPGQNEQLEEKIVQHAVVANPPAITVSNASEIPGILARLLTDDFKPAFESAGHWEPYGTIAIACDQQGMEIEINKLRIGSTVVGRTTIGRVTPGPRTVQLSRPGFFTQEKQVEVVRGQTVTVEFIMVQDVDTTIAVSRDIVFWTGVGTAVAGVAITALAIHQASKSDVVACFYPAGDPRCGSSEFLEAAPPDVDDPMDSPTDGGIPLAPLGYSMIGAGSAWALSTALFEEDQWPWIEVGIGALVFVASMGVSMLADGKNAVARQRDGE